MRDTHKMKYDALNFEYGYDTSEHDEWNTYASANEEDNFGISILEVDDTE